MAHRTEEYVLREHGDYWLFSRGNEGVLERVLVFSEPIDPEVLLDTFNVWLPQPCVRIDYKREAQKGDVSRCAEELLLYGLPDEEAWSAFMRYRLRGRARAESIQFWCVREVDPTELVLGTVFETQLEEAVKELYGDLIYRGPELP